MKIRRLSGFSLMEMMVVLLIIAIVLAATTPMVSRKMARVSEGGGGCKWSDWSQGISYGNSGENVLIGPSNNLNEPKAKLSIISSDKPHILFTNEDLTDIMNLGVKNSSVIFTNSTPDTTNSVVIGQSIDLGETPDSYLVAIGANAKALGTYATALGYNAKANSNYSIAIGENASADNEKSKGSIAIGYNSKAIGLYGDGSVQDDSSIAIGNNSTAFGSKSVAIGAGAKAGDPTTNTTADYAVALGADAVASNNEIVLGGTGGSRTPQTVIIPGDLKVHGNVYLAQDDDKHVFIRTDSGPDKQIRDNTSSFAVDRINNLFVERTSTSDRRLKNVGETFKGGLEELRKLDLYHFTFKNDKKKIPHVGVMAQDLQKIFPDAVIKGDDGFLKIRMEDMFYAVINAVKELDAKFTKLAEQVKSNMDMITTLQEKINAQEQEIVELKKQNAEFEKRLAKLEKKAGKKGE